MASIHMQSGWRGRLFRTAASWLPPMLLAVGLAACGDSNEVVTTAGPAATAPTVTTAPASQTVNVGQSATFSVTAEGTAPLAYQWKRGGNDISGATSATFTLASATMADNGASFSVSVSNASGSVVSGAATLTVIQPTGIGPAGGTVTGPDGSQAVIPADALSTYVDIAIAKSGNGAPAFPPTGVTAVGAIFAITPHGQAFTKPVTVRIPFDAAQVPGGSTPKMFKAQPSGAFAEVAGATVSGGFMEASVMGFSFFAVAYSTPPQTGSQTFDLGANRWPTSVAAYPGGGVVVAGIGGGQVWVSKVAQNGTVEWTRTTQGEITFLTSDPRVAVGPTGNVYVAAATSKDEAGGSLGGPTVIRMTSYNPAGSERMGWPRRVSVNYNNYPASLVTDSSDNVYIYGTSFSSNLQAHDTYRPLLASFTEGGAARGSAGIVDFGGAAPSRRILAKWMVLKPGGGMYLSASILGFAAIADPGSGEHLQSFDVAGATVTGFPVRLSQTASTIAGLAVTPNGVAYVLTGQLHAVNPNSTLVSGFPKSLPVPATGSLGFDFGDNPGLVASATGNLYYAGYARRQVNNFGGDDVFGQSLTSDGAQRSGFPVYVGTAGDDRAKGVTIDAAGSNFWIIWLDDTNNVGKLTRFNAN